MKVIFVSSYYNHHQESFSQAMYRLLEGEFSFIQTAEMSEQRRSLGYSDNYREPFILSLQKERETCEQKILEADAVIFGSAPEALIRKRIKEGKLVLRYSERPLKEGSQPLKYVPRFLKWHLLNPKGKPIYLLCASAYASGDYQKYRLFKGHAYRWGYFPRLKTYEELDDLWAKHNPKTLLWVGRMIDWKHPDDVVRLAKRLKDEGYSFILNMIGTGDMADQLQQMINEMELHDRVFLLGSMKPEEVRTYMETAGIFIATSDCREGWGAVLNEAMNSGCAVVASHAMGATPYLVQHEKNGLIYRSQNLNDLYDQVSCLLHTPSRQLALGKEAYQTMLDVWNADNAADRLCRFIRSILSGDPVFDLYESGPCSPAPTLKDNDIKEIL